MSSLTIQRATRVLINAAVLLCAGVVGYFWAPDYSAKLHATVFTGLSSVAIALTLIGSQTFGKLDAVWRDVSAFPTERTRRLSVYIERFRRLVALWTLAVVFGLVFSASAAYGLKEKVLTDVRPLYVLGYLGMAFAVLGSARVFVAYLGLDKFQRRAKQLIENEQELELALRATASKQPIEEASPSTGAWGVASHR